MKSCAIKYRQKKTVTNSVLIALLMAFLLAGSGLAASNAQEEGPEHPLSDNECKECHLDIADSWSHSPHAHAYDDPVFQERWNGLGKPGDCLLCHTTNYNASAASYSATGVSCEACHGLVNAQHPPGVVPIRADTEYCGTCHTTTLHEWRLTGHASAEVGCMDCHDPHSQEQLFAVSDEMCLNCHQDDMERYLEDLHVQKDIGCVDCHALVIPPDPIPEDGIVPTGHTFTITPATCVACHTDALHAGFSLPGYENGAKTANGSITPTLTTESITELIDYQPESDQALSAEQRIQALEASLANRQLTTILQGGIIGLVLGGTTAWLVAANTRRTLVELGTGEEDEQSSSQDNSEDQES